MFFLFFVTLLSRDAKLCVIPKNLTEIITEIEHIVSVKCNKEASKVSMIVAKVIFTAIMFLCKITDSPVLLFFVFLKLNFADFRVKP